MFAEACRKVSTSTFPVTDDEKLMLYALYKIATVGEPPKKKDTSIDPVYHAKYNAWYEFSQTVTTKAHAESLYVSLVDKLSSRK